MGAEGGVEVVDVGLVVARVVDFHCFGVKVRFEGGVGVAEGWEGVGHLCRGDGVGVLGCVGLVRGCRGLVEASKG